MQNDFFDKIKDTSVFAFEKAKDVSVSTFEKAKDSSKRFMLINDFKSKIRGYNNDKSKLFTQMGMDLYIASKKNQNIEFKIDKFVEDIDEINDRIKNLQERLALLESNIEENNLEDDN